MNTPCKADVTAAERLLRKARRQAIDAALTEGRSATELVPALLASVIGAATLLEGPGL